jgi:hypothetical protein
MDDDVKAATRREGELYEARLEMHNWVGDLRLLVEPQVAHCRSMLADLYGGKTGFQVVDRDTSEGES